RHHTAVPYKEVPALMARLRRDDSIASKALQLTILTAARPGEACGARWDEFEADVWTVPAARMKRNRPHRVPLSDAARALLASVPRVNDVVFPSTKAAHITTPTIIESLRNLGRAETVHGFRSAFSTWASECTKYPDHVVELALAHAVGGAVERAYRRSDLFEARRVLMEDWAKFLIPADPQTRPDAGHPPARQAYHHKLQGACNGEAEERGYIIVTCRWSWQQ